MNGENLISWSIPNFVTIVLMIAIIWVVIGSLGHLLVRQPARRRAVAGDNTTAAPGGVLVTSTRFSISNCWRTR